MVVETGRAEKLPPPDVEAEEAVIASLLVDPEAIYRVAPTLKPDDFFREKNAWAFEACLALWGRNESINQITVSHELARRGRLEEVGGAAYLSRLVTELPTSVGVEHYAGLVQRDSSYRRLISAAGQIAQMAYHAGPDVGDVLARAETLIAAIRQGESIRDFVHVKALRELRVAGRRAKARRLHLEHGVDLLIVDHLQLMHGGGRIENRVQEVSYITRSLKELARDLDVPVIACSQLSRAAEARPTHVPQLSDLRDSGSIEQDADVVMFIYREGKHVSREDWQRQPPDRPTDNYPAGIAQIIVAKHRNGPTGTIHLRFREKIARFEDLLVREPEELGEEA